MKLLEDRIRKEGVFLPGGIIKVDNFLNHMIDIELMQKIGEAFYEHFADKNITKILTIEASGIGIACIAATYFKVPVVFAKKTPSLNLSDDDKLYKANVHSFTRGTCNLIRVDKKYILPNDRILIIDDFLASGEALFGLMSITEQAQATLCGVGICIEKAFQQGGSIIRQKGIDICSLAIVDLDPNGNLIITEQ